MKKSLSKSLRRCIISLVCGAFLCLSACTVTLENEGSTVVLYGSTSASESVSETTGTNTNWAIPEFSGSPYAIINGNQPFFTEYTTEVFETYSDLDSLGRCGVAFANICKEIMPTEPRGQIGNIKPSGWHTVKYNGVVSGNYLYNRCHLIGYQLAGENANEKNLITGTRYLNITGMVKFEDMIAAHIKLKGGHVLYRVTPIFTGDNLLADGVLMEAYSVEDKGRGVKFCVFCYNVQPGIVIDYKTGDSRLESDNS